MTVTKKGLSVQVDSLGDYRTLKGVVDTQKLTYCTHAFKNQNVKHLVFAGLSNLPLQNIIYDIENQGNICNKIELLERSTAKHQEKSDQVQNPVFNFKSFHSRYLITVGLKTDLKIVRNYRFVCSINVYWERFKKTR